MEISISISIDIDAAVPVFSQLIQQVKGAVMDGKLAPGDPLPSIRQLANDLDLNSKTVAKAYRLLERDSVIQTRGYRGTFVHPNAVANSAIDLNAWVQSKMSETVEACRDAGATDSEIRIAFGNEMHNRNRSE